jgi:hypothetical protein
MEPELAGGGAVSVVLIRAVCGGADAGADLKAARFWPQQPIGITSFWALSHCRQDQRRSSRSLQMHTAHGSDHAW